MTELTLGLAGGLNVRAIRQLVQREPISGRLGVFNSASALKDPHAAMLRLQGQSATLRRHSAAHLALGIAAIAEARQLLATAPPRRRNTLARHRDRIRALDLVDAHSRPNYVTALHESAHAVIGATKGLRIAVVAAHRHQGDDSLGRVCWSGIDRAGPRGLAVVAMAGTLAENRLPGQYSELRGDDEKTAKMALGAVYSGSEFSAQWAACLVEAGRLVATHWPCIEAIARSTAVDRLLRHGEFSRILRAHGITYAFDD